MKALLSPTVPVRRALVNPVAIAASTAASACSNLPALHTIAEPRHPVTTTVACRVVDAKLRITVQAPETPVLVAAERRGGMLTVFLPGSTEGPAEGFTVAALPLDARGRLTLGAAVCAELGITPCDTVLTRHDPDRGVIEVFTPSLVDAALTAAVTSVRRPNLRRVNTGAATTPAQKHELNLAARLRSV